MGAASEPSFETDEDDIAMEKNAGLIMGVSRSIRQSSSVPNIVHCIDKQQ